MHWIGEAGVIVSGVGRAGIRLPWPAEWSASRPKVGTVLGVGIMGVLALGAISGGVSELLSGDDEAAVILIALGSYFGTATALVLLMLIPRSRVPARSVARQTTESGHEGIAIFYSARLRYLLAAILFETFVFAAAYALGGVLEWEMPHVAPVANIIDVTIFGAFAIACLWFPLESWVDGSAGVAHVWFSARMDYII